MSITDKIKTAECNQEKGIIKVNPEKSSLTVEKLKTFEGMENIADSEAEEIVLSIQNLCAIIYDFLTQPEKEDVSEINTNNLKIAA